MKYTWLILFVAVMLLAGCGSDSEDREDSNAFMALAESSLDDGNWDDAIEYLEKAVELDPGLAPAYQKLGLIHEAVLSDTETAVHYYALAVEYEKNPARKSRLSRWLKNHKLRSNDLSNLQANQNDVIEAYKLPSSAVGENQPKPAVSPAQYNLLKDTVESQEKTIDDLQADNLSQKDEIVQLKSQLEKNEKTKIELQSQIEDLLRANAAQTPETELQIKYKEAVRKNSSLYKLLKITQAERDKAIAENARLKGQSQPPTANNQNRGHTLYTVRPGDTLRNIAEAVYGDREMDETIYKANRDKLTNMNVVPVGVQLKIPKR
jgi:tetratricopeptide (TPR) repeat protein